MLDLLTRPQSPAARRLMRPLTLLFFAVMGGMAAYEGLQTLAFPGLTIWASHLITIGVSSVGAVVAGYFVLRRESRLLESVLAELRERERAEAENARLALIVNSSDDAIFGATCEGDIVAWNVSAERMYGYTAEEIKGKHISVLIPPDRHDEMVANQAKLCRGDAIVHYDFEHMAKDGSRLQVSLTLSPIKDAEGVVTGVSAISRDITKRKRAEERLKEYEKVVEGSDEMIAVIDRNYHYLLANRAYLHQRGLERRNVVGHSVSEVLGEEVFKGVVKNELDKCFQGNIVKYEIKHQYPELGERDVLASYFPIEGPHGVDRAACVLQDITVRKRAAEALQNEVAFSESVIDSLPDAFFVVNSKGRFVRWNRNAENVLGYSTQELAALDPLANIAEDERPLAADKMQEALAKGRASGEVHLFTKDRRKIPYILTATRTVIGDNVYLVGIGVDISERKRVEAEKARLVTAIEQSAEGVVITNTTGEIEYVNPAFTRITGYSREEVLGQNPRILKSGKQDPVFYQQLWATILKGEIWHGELLNRRKDGKIYTEELNIAPVRGAGGEITHYIATKQDVTERKRLEVQFQQAQKMEAVGRLAGGVAHDFNNLLTVINGYSEMMLDRLNPNDSSGGHLEEIRKAGEKAASLTRQLLAFSRQQVLAPRVLDLNTLVADVEKMLRRLIGEDIELAIVRDSALGQVKADPGQIDQILMNLAVNARDAMPEGGKLVIETANVDLDEAYADRRAVVPQGRYAMLAVSDTGIGMDAQTQAHIFEPFFTTKEKGKGTGLGLAMVYGTVKQSGGFIWVYSEPGRGTTFRIYLPRVDEASGSLQASEAREHPVAGSETILLVEDEEAVRALAARILQDLGYKVLESTSPEDALEIGARHKEAIDLLLTDVVLPGMSGRKVAEHLAFFRPGMKVLYMSGYTDNAVIRNGVLETGTAFLQKPFSTRTLPRKVREVLDAACEESS